MDPDKSTIHEFNPVNNKELPAIEEARLNLRIPHNLFDNLLAHAQKRNFPNVETFAEFVLSQAVTQKIGAPIIEAPAEMSGHSTGKISGPSNSGMVRRG